MSYLRPVLTSSASMQARSFENEQGIAAQPASEEQQSVHDKGMCMHRFVVGQPQKGVHQRLFCWSGPG